MKNTVIFGMPGAGKGIQSGKMIGKYDFGHISAGDVPRNEIKNGTEPGKTAEGYTDNGQLIPDELTIDTLASVYDSFGKEHKGVIFDGFPRTIPQAEALKKMLAERGYNMVAMAELFVPEDGLMKRLPLRGQQSGRSNGNEETTKKRPNVYNNQTFPLIDWYKGKNIHHHVEGPGTVEDILAHIESVINVLQTFDLWGLNSELYDLRRILKRKIVENDIYILSKSLAPRVVRLYKYLIDEHKEYVLSKQLLRSGTGIGANVHEGKNEQSRADFCSKTNIALKEATESNYWIDLLRGVEYISESECRSLSDDYHKTQAVPTKIVKATRSSLNQ